MKDRFKVIFSQLNKQSRRKWLHKAISVFAAVSVFITCYVLIIPAITLTMENADTYCGFEEHIHSDGCYDSVGNVICGKTEHEHDMLCFTQEVNSAVYCCGFECEHEHNESCYSGEELVCGLEKHKHSDECLLKMPGQEFNIETEKYSVFASASNGCLPEGTELHVSEIKPNGSFEGYEDCELFGIRISFSDSSGEKITPKRPLSFRIIFNTLLYECRRTVLKIDKDGGISELMCANVSTDGVSFVDTEVADYVIACRKTEDKQEIRTLEAAVNDTEIKVEYTYLSKIPDGTELKVEEFNKFSREYKDFVKKTKDAISEEEPISSRVFDISLVKDGKEIEPESPVNVSISAKESFAGENERLNIVHFVENEEPEILKIALSNEDNTQITYKQSSFSAVVMTTVADNYSGGYTGTYEYTTVSESILDNNDVINRFDDANEWQIVSGKYKGNTVSQKIDTLEHIRGQKNVIPTGIENEFLVYLSLDIDFQNLLTSYIVNDDTGLVIETNNATDDDVDENWSKHQAHCEKCWNKKGDTTALPLFPTSSTDYKLPFTLVFKFSVAGEAQSITMIRYTCNNNFSQGYVSMKLGPLDAATAEKLKVKDNYGWYQVGRADKAEGESNTFIITLNNSMVEKVLSHFQDVEIGTLSDSMGNTVGSQTFGTDEGIFATDIVASAVKGELVTGNASISEDGKSISWNPKVSSLNASEASSGWFNNIAELIYKIKYVAPRSTGLINNGTTVTANTQANVQTNASTIITYQTSSSTGTSGTGQISLTSPVITGMQYEIKALKQDDSGNPLPGASFEIYTKDGTTNAKIGEAVSDANGVIDFTNLQSGTYYFKEISAPDGYMKDETEYGPYVLSYTTSASNPYRTNVTSANLIGQGTLEEALLNPDNPIIVVNVPRPKYDLPKTGGIGTGVYYAAGIMVIMLSASVYIMINRKRRAVSINK